MFRTFLMAVFALSTMACDPGAALVSSAQGTWKSEAAEDMGTGAFATRNFTFKGDRWQLTFTIFADQALQTPLLALDFEGPWEPGKASTTVAGATEATFDFASKKITLKADVAKNFGMESCGLQVGVAKDVSATGCSFIPSVDAYGREYDLLKVDGTSMWLGARPADGNMGSEDKRPAALGAKLVKASK